MKKRPLIANELISEDLVHYEEEETKEGMVNRATQTSTNMSMNRIYSSSNLPILESKEEYGEDLRLIVGNQNLLLKRKVFDDLILKNFKLRRKSLRSTRFLNTGSGRPFHFEDLLSPLCHCMRTVVEDEFTMCFRATPTESWNMNLAYFLIWLLGAFIRYLIVFPLRGSVFVFGTIFFGIFSIVLSFWKGKYSGRLIQKMLLFYSSTWIITIGGVIKYHGNPPKKRTSQIYVANHTTLFDYVFLLNKCPFSSVGQKHTGFSGILQRVLSPFRGIWFERFEKFDRSLVQSRIVQHINDPRNPRLVIFPEGVCVNNDYIVQFKKGVFEMENVQICPIAIKYKKFLSDPFWDSRNETFFFHVLRLMKEWATYVEIHFLEPQTRRKGETPIQFSERVKKMIANKINIKNVHWDGYLKYYRPSHRFIEEKQKMYGRKILGKMQKLEEEEEEEEEEGEEVKEEDIPQIVIGGDDDEEEGEGEKEEEEEDEEDMNAEVSLKIEEEDKKGK